MLTDGMHDVAENLVDYRLAKVITAINFAKAFNGMSYQHCLRAFAAHGASSDVIQLLATSFDNCTMSLRVGESWSSSRPVTGG